VVKTVTISHVGCNVYRVDGEGFAASLDACKAYCARRGFVVAGIFG